MGNCDPYSDLPNLWSLAITVYSGRGADIVMQSTLWATSPR